MEFGIYLELEGAFVKDLISKVPGSHLCIQNITIVEWWKMNRRQKKDMTAEKRNRPAHGVSGINFEGTW